MNLSIVIPLYNKENSIKKTIISVLEQDDIDGCEIIVVNDGSSDSSETVVREIETHKEIKLITQKNSGVSSARNLGIKIAKNKNIAVLDADDLMLPGTIKEYKSAIKNFPDVGLYCFSYRIVRSDISKANMILTQKEGLIENYFYHCSRNKNSELTTQSSIIFKKNIALEVGGYTNGITHSEDIEFCARLAMKSKVFVSPHVAAEYRMDAENRSDIKLKPELRYVVKSLLKIREDYKYPYLEHYIFKHVVHSAFFLSKSKYFKESKSLLSEYFYLRGSIYYKVVAVMLYLINLLGLRGFK